MEFKGLKEKLGVSEEQLDHLRQLRVIAENRYAVLMMSIWKRGGTIHRSNPVTVAKNRKKNKAARKARRANR